MHSCKLIVIYSACNLPVFFSFSLFYLVFFLILNFRFAPLAKNLYFIPERLLMQVWSCIYVEAAGKSLSQFWGMSLGPWLRFLAFSITVWSWWMFLFQVRNCVPYWSFLAKLICLPGSSSCFRHQCRCSLEGSAQLTALIITQRSWLQVWVWALHYAGTRFWRQAEYCWLWNPLWLVTMALSVPENLQRGFEFSSFNTVSSGWEVFQEVF